jgi:hypothetical protein
MKEIPDFLIGLSCGVAFLGFLLIFTNNSPRQIKQKMQKEAIQIEQNMQKQAISHGAAHYEVDTNAVVIFKWNN